MYPLTFDLVQSKNESYGYSNMQKYYLKAVIQQYIQNGEKLYGCTFSLDQIWVFANGYNILSWGYSPYNFSTGNIVMLFYSS